MPGNCGNTGQTTVATIKSWRNSSANTPQPLTSADTRHLDYISNPFFKKLTQQENHHDALRTRGLMPCRL